MPAGPGHDGTVTFPAAHRGPADFSQNGLAGEHGESFADSADVTIVRAAPGTLLALPRHYEPAYAYPLLIWLPDESQSEDEAASWLEQLGGRNHVAVGLRPVLFAHGSRKGAIDRLRYALRRIESEMLIHPQRRFVAGIGHGGRTAIEWLIEKPGLFAGAVAIDVEAQPVFAARSPVDHFAGRRVLWANRHPNSRTTGPIADLEAMKSLGIGVEMWQPHGPEATASLGRRIDEWILAAIPTTVSH